LLPISRSFQDAKNAAHFRHDHLKRWLWPLTRRAQGVGSRNGHNHPSRKPDITQIQSHIIATIAIRAFAATVMVQHDRFRLGQRSAGIDLPLQCRRPGGDCMTAASITLGATHHQVRRQPDEMGRATTHLRCSAHAAAALTDIIENMLAQSAQPILKQ
jgi:hypothetical protein